VVDFNFHAIRATDGVPHYRDLLDTFLPTGQPIIGLYRLG